MPEKILKLKKRIEKEELFVKDVKVINEKYKVNIEFGEKNKGYIEINGLKDINELKEIKTGKLSNNKIKNGLIGTEVIAINPITIKDATIVLSKNRNITNIVKCENFDFNSSKCDAWIKTDIPFIDNGTDIIFTVYSFNAYAGAIIAISKAEHLDSNKEFVSNIYEEVKDLDDNWSETIPAGHYVRVVFNKQLSSDNDITIYPRTINGSPKINVYEFEQNITIAEFTSINDNEYNKVLLTNLQNSQDTFDLLIFNGGVQLNHIIDPPTPGSTTFFFRQENITNPSVLPRVGTNGTIVGRVAINRTDTFTAAASATIATGTTNGLGKYWNEADGTFITANFSIPNGGFQAINGTWAIGIQTDCSAAASAAPFMRAILFKKNATGEYNLTRTQDTVLNGMINLTALNGASSSDICGTTNVMSVNNTIIIPAQFATGFTNLTGDDRVGVRFVLWVKATTSTRNVNLDYNQTISNITISNLTFLKPNSNPNTPSNLKINSTHLLQRNLTTETLQVRFGVSDPDTEDSLTYNITWFKNNRSVVNLSRISITNPGTAVENLGDINTTKGDTWKAQVVIKDNRDGISAFVNTTELLILNSNATITQPAFNQTSYNNLQTMNVSARFSDDDADANSITFQWFKNNATIRRTTNSNLANGTNTSDVLTPASFTIGDDIRVMAFAFDNEQNSTLLNSTIIIIQSANTAPNNPSNLVINSTTNLQLNLTDEDLRMNFLCNDPDTSDTLTFHLTAFKNYVNQFQLQGGCNDPEYKSILLDNINTTKFDNWSFSVNVSDIGGLYSGTISSAVNLTIKNSLPIIGNVTLDIADSVSIIEGGNKSFLFSFVVTDLDNSTDINNFSAVANITKAEETSRYNDTFVNPNDGGCKVKNNINTNAKNFSCTINIVFYDGAGTWTISTRINDTNEFAQNITKTFSIQETSAVSLNPSTITFPRVIPNQNNISALFNITIINIGNDDISGKEANGETINITAITLVPATGTTFIPASNFTIAEANISATHLISPCDVSRPNNVTLLKNITADKGYANFTGAINGSAVLAQASEKSQTFAICLIHAPNDLAGTTYSTSSSGAWTILAF